MQRSGLIPLAALTWAPIMIDQALYTTLQNLQSGYSCYSVNALIASPNRKFVDGEKQFYFANLAQPTNHLRFPRIMLMCLLG